MFRLVVSISVGLWIVLSVALARGDDDAAKSLPKFETAGKLVRMYFERLEGYQQGDFITREQATEVFRYLKKIQWDVRDQNEILAAMYSDKDFLSKTLRSENATKFMRQIAKLPNGFDRLERMSQLPRGKRMVSDLSTDKGGYKMIEYLADTKGGKNLGKQLDNAPRGQDFNQPTGKIYTVDGLLKRLQKSYDAELAALKS